jgi:F-type H+-transporting ATPase subunit delta
MTGIRISSRYAKSLLNLSFERNCMDAAYADMQLVHKVIDENRELEVLLNSPVVKTDKKVKILDAIFQGKLDPLTHGFIKLLTEKGREGFLKEVAQSFIHQVKAHKNITEVELISAGVLDEATRNKALDAVRMLAKGEVALVEKIDADLIGGFILRVADKQIDASISGRIRQLRRDFSENPYIPEI